MSVSIKEGPAELETPGTTAKEDDSLTQTVYRTDERSRMVRILKEAEERYRNELMDIEERDVLRSRIVDLKTKLAASA
jgi:hypothetical protein